MGYKTVQAHNIVVSHIPNSNKTVRKYCCATQQYNFQAKK